MVRYGYLHNKVIISCNRRVIRVSNFNISRASGPGGGGAMLLKKLCIYRF